MELPPRSFPALCDIPTDETADTLSSTSAKLNPMPPLYKVALRRSHPEQGSRQKPHASQLLRLFDRPAYQQFFSSLLTQMLPDVSRRDTSVNWDQRPRLCLPFQPEPAKFPGLVIIHQLSYCEGYG
jgi:hypothetical protein